MTTTTTTINIKGMTCGGCSNSVSRLLQALPGMEKCEVSLANATANITYDPSKLNLTTITDAVVAAGFEIG